MEWICSDGIRIKEEDDAEEAAPIVLDPPLPLSFALLSAREGSGTVVVVVVVVSRGLLLILLKRTGDLCRNSFVDGGWWRQGMIAVVVGRYEVCVDRSNER